MKTQPVAGPCDRAVLVTMALGLQVFGYPAATCPDMVRPGTEVLFQEPVMKLSAAIAVLVALAPGLAWTQPVFAATTSGLEASCLQQAQWPVTASHAYRNAAVTTKQAMRNAYNPDVSAMKTLCSQAVAPAAPTSLAGDQQDLMSRLSARYGDDFSAPIARFSATYTRLLAQTSGHG